MFSFIAGVGASQLARLSSIGLHSLFSSSVSDSQHKPLHYKMALYVRVCMCGVSASACACSSPAWCHEPSSHPVQA